MRFPFRRRRRVLPRPLPDPRAAQAPQSAQIHHVPEDPGVREWEGELPPHYDHVVRIGVEVTPEHAGAFLALVRSRPWQIREAEGAGADASASEGGAALRRYDVHVALSGAVLGAVRAALSEFRHALDLAGVPAHVVFGTRLRPQRTSARAYQVLPRMRMPEREWLAVPARALFRWRSKGHVHGRSLTEAESRLREFAARNPEAGTHDELMVVGPPDTASPPEDDGDRPVPDARYLLLGTLTAVIGVVALVLLVTVWRPEGVTLRGAIASLVAIPFLFGVWQMLRRVPEGRINTWLPLALTLLAAPLTVALGTLSHDAYLEAFGILPGEVATTGPGRLVALIGALPLVLFALLISLGAFGFLRHFHITSHGHARFLQWLLTGSVVLVYVLTAVTALMDRDADTGRTHIADYRAEGGAARTHAGVRPSVVCVELGKDPVNRIGPPLTTDRPVLYFAGAKNVDLLWDREEGLTKVTRFSVTLTPVTALDADCPEPSDPPKDTSEDTSEK